MEKNNAMIYKDWFDGSTWNLSKMLEYKIKEFIFESFYKDCIIHCHHYLLKRKNNYYIIEGVEYVDDYMFNAPYLTKNIDSIKFIYLPEKNKNIKNLKYEQLTLF